MICLPGGAEPLTATRVTARALAAAVTIRGYIAA
jgi:hypothetical protein